MSEITISHSHASGTVVSGDPRPHQSVLKNLGFRWSRNVGWYIQRSRDKAPEMWKINKAAEELEAAGFEVEVEIDDERRSVAEVEAERAERAEGRAEYLEGKAAKLAADGEAKLDHAHKLAEHIPFGQPILVDHYSARRDRSFRDKIHNTQGKGFALLDEAKGAAHAASAAVATQTKRESGPTTKRRIDKLEADHRYVSKHWGDGEAKTERLAELTEQIDYWKAHLEAIGYVILTKADMPPKGSLIKVRGRKVRLIKANPKTVTILSIETGMTLKYGYEDVALIESEE
jgi:hypothetical protein